MKFKLQNGTYIRVEFLNCSLCILPRRHCHKCKSSALSIFLLYNLNSHTRNEKPMSQKIQQNHIFEHFLHTSTSTTESHPPNKFFKSTTEKDQGKFSTNSFLLLSDIFDFSTFSLIVACST